MAPKNTTELLTKLRNLMKSRKCSPSVIDAYIIPSGDAHQSEYIASCDERRAFITGFTGSNGTAIVTPSKAALWTDGRYFLQASRQLDDNWILMKMGLPDTPSESKWLNKILGNGKVVGVDPWLYDYEKWNSLSQELELGGIKLIAVYENLIDILWEDQPSWSLNPIFSLEERYSGLHFVEKISKLRNQLKEEEISTIILTNLDEIAYIFNLRGSDIKYNPVFFSYAAITLESAYLFVNKEKLTSEVIKMFNSTEEVTVNILEYSDINNFVDKRVVSGSGKIWFSNHASRALTELVPSNRRICKVTPVALMKAVKNEVEIKGMEACHIRDAVALIRFFSWLEEQASKGMQTEISAADKLLEFRKELSDFVGLSFNTISSVGANAAVVHYSPSYETDKHITVDEIYLCDSGGQYKDGTTDVTRTLHFGSASQYEKECFTRVVKGVIAVATCVFPAGITGNYLDSFARKALWDVGLDYRHGTGHGIGMYLNVHEGPMGISWKPMPDDPGLKEGMFLSDEPGYYEDGKFGIRIENIVRIVKADTLYNHKKFLTFETVTLVPIETKMLIPSMLAKSEIEWINAYHCKCAEKVGPILLENGYTNAYNWLVRETQPIG